MIVFQNSTLQKLKQACVDALPSKAFGLLAGNREPVVDMVVRFETNIRAADPEIDLLFESYGDFYKNVDRGFWISAEEQIAVYEELARTRKKIIAVFHSHRCREAVPSKIDLDLHADPKLLLAIVSVVNAQAPDVKIYSKNGTRAELREYCEAQEARV